MRNWISLLGRSAVAAVAVLPSLWLASLHWQQAAVQRQLQTARADVAAAQARLDGMQQQETALAAPAGEGQAGHWQLPAEPDVAAVLQAVEAQAERCHVELSGLSAKPGQDDFRVRLQLAGRGTPVAVCTFLAAIERQSRLLVIDSGQVTAAGNDQLAFELSVSAWHGGGAR